MDPSPTIAIVGRPNVGKSTLFNRLIGKRHAIIAEEAGTTRDRISHKFEHEGYEMILVDTGGIQHGKQEDIEADVASQAKIAIEEADITVFVIDSTQNLTVDDFAAADILRKSEKPVILVANKCDNPEIETNIYNIFELGFGEPIAISAIHKIGIEKLQNQLVKSLKELKFKKQRKKEPESKTIDLCILGRPNAGKSSLVNTFIGSEKVIVSEIPGTTRDVTDTEIEYNERKYNLIDTAGLRRPGKRKPGIEKFSSLRCFSSIERSDIVVLLIDGSERISNQDANIASYALEAEKGLIIAINKIDLFEKGEEARNRILARIKKLFAFVPWTPLVFISAKNKQNTYKILELAEEIIKERKKKIKTAEFNGFLKKITYKHLPASSKNKKPKFAYGSQVDTEPPKIRPILQKRIKSPLHIPSLSRKLHPRRVRLQWHTHPSKIQRKSRES